MVTISLHLRARILEGKNCSVCCNRNLSCLFQPFLFFIVIPLIAFCYFRGVRLVNPFYSIWASPQGVTMGRAFIGIAMAAGILYFIILMVFIIKAIYNIWQRRKQFKSMAKGLRIHYMVCFIFKHFVLLYFYFSYHQLWTSILHKILSLLIVYRRVFLSFLFCLTFYLLCCPEKAKLT